LRIVQVAAPQWDGAPRKSENSCERLPAPESTWLRKVIS
jgi:hypothetical protein